MPTSRPTKSLEETLAMRAPLSKREPSHGMWAEVVPRRPIKMRRHTKTCKISPPQPFRPRHCMALRLLRLSRFLAVRLISPLCCAGSPAASSQRPTRDAYGLCCDLPGQLAFVSGRVARGDTSLLHRYPTRRRLCQQCRRFRSRRGSPRSSRWRRRGDAGGHRATRCRSGDEGRSREMEGGGIIGT